MSRNRKDRRHLIPGLQEALKRLTDLRKLVPDVFLAPCLMAISNNIEAIRYGVACNRRKKPAAHVPAGEEK